MNNTTLQTTELADFRVTIIPEAEQSKTDALALSKSVTTVSTTAQQQDAISAASLMKGLLRDVEKARVAVKEPVLAAGRAIDAVAKKFSTELETETKRVEALASAFQKEEDRKAEAARQEQERQLCEDREREAAALRKIAEEADAERRRNLAAIAAAADEEARESAQRKADADAEARSEEVRLNQEAIAEQERLRHAMVVEPPKPEGARVVRKMDYELKDVRALYASRPDLVELTDRRSLILAAISITNAPAIPGIYVFESIKIQSKAS